jgi:hypothetical protein
MNPHVKENVRYPSNKATEIDCLERIAHFCGEKFENPINAKDGFLEPPLRYIDN